MTIDKVVALVAAGAVLLWPSLSGAAKGFLSRPPRKTSYLEAIEDLGSVRARLAETDCLGEQQRDAINTLTIALVGGSEK